MKHKARSEWFWLSFSDANGGHLGTSLVGPAMSSADAVRLAAAKGCSLNADQAKGASVTAFAIPPENVKHIPTEFRNRLLDLAGLEELNRIVAQARGVASELTFVRETEPGVYRGKPSTKN